MKRKEHIQLLNKLKNKKLKNRTLLLSPGPTAYFLLTSDFLCNIIPFLNPMEICVVLPAVCESWRNNLLNTNQNYLLNLRKYYESFYWELEQVGDKKLMREENYFQLMASRNKISWLHENKILIVSNELNDNPYSTTSVEKRHEIVLNLANACNCYDRTIAINKAFLSFNNDDNTALQVTPYKRICARIGEPQQKIFVTNVINGSKLIRHNISWFENGYQFDFLVVRELGQELYIDEHYYIIYNSMVVLKFTLIQENTCSSFFNKHIINGLVTAMGYDGHVKPIDFIKKLGYIFFRRGFLLDYESLIELDKYIDETWARDCNTKIFDSFY